MENNLEKPKPNIVGLVLARGGSKGVKLKNIKPLGGKPLLGWVVSALRDSNVLDAVYVSTDHDEIAKVTEDCGAIVHRRDPEYAQDSTSSIASVQEFLKYHPEVDIVFHAQGTCPFLHPFHVREAVELFNKYKCDSVFAVQRRKTFRWELSDDETVIPVNFDLSARPLRKDWEGEMHESGHFYMASKEILLQGCFQAGKCMYYEIQHEYCLDIDTEFDFEVAEQAIHLYGYDQNPKKNQSSEECKSQSAP